MTANVTLDDQLKASAAVMLTLYGTVELELGETDNETVRILIYDAGGLLTGSMEPVRLPDGKYTLVIMGGSDFFTAPNTLEGLYQAGLALNVDFVCRDVEVSAGAVTETAVNSVPTLDEGRFFYTDPDAAMVATSKTSVSAGRFFTIRAHTAFKRNTPLRSAICSGSWSCPPARSFIPEL